MGGLLQGNELLQVGDVPRVRKELNFTQRNVERIQQLLVAHKQERDILQEMLEDNLEVDRQRNIEFETILASDCVVVEAVENILGWWPERETTPYSPSKMFAIFSSCCGRTRPSIIH